MDELVAQSVVDARNEPCPRPILMTKRAIEKAQLGEVVEIVVNDHTSKENVLKYCWNHGQEIISSREEGADFHLVLRKSPEKLAEKPLPAIGPCGQRWD
ncbi:MAG: sulfurtransferase TusA family protein [Conexivisphaerales archaeon]|jgi:TusA-related sulfurtransferase